MAPRGRDADDEEDDDDDIGQYVVEGKALKKAIQRGRRKTVPFAFCPVSGDDLTWFATHKKKPAARIAKRTKRESGQFKVAFGTFVVQGKLLLLTCIDTIPELARRMKRHLARENIRMNVRVMDLDGIELEADIDRALEAEPDDETEVDDDEDEAPAPSGAAPAVADGNPFDARMAAVQGPVLAARGEAGERLRHLLGGLFEAQDKGDRRGAEALLGRLETEVGKLMRSSARPSVAPAGPTPAAPEPPAIDRKAQVALARQIASLRSRTEALQDEAAERIMAALEIGARQVRGGELIGAASTLDRIAAALDRVEARQSENNP